MKTMSLVSGTQLFLVNPLCEIDAVAVRRASGAADLVNTCQIVASLDEALVGCTGAFGMTVRARELGRNPCRPERRLQRLRQFGSRAARLVLVRHLFLVMRPMA